jgi:hypothetical protein
MTRWAAGSLAVATFRSSEMAFPAQFPPSEPPPPSAAASPPGVPLPESPFPPESPPAASVPPSPAPPPLLDELLLVELLPVELLLELLALELPPDPPLAEALLAEALLLPAEPPEPPRPDPVLLLVPPPALAALLLLLEAPAPVPGVEESLQDAAHARTGPQRTMNAADARCLNMKPHLISSNDARCGKANWVLGASSRANRLTHRAAQYANTARGTPS